MHVAIPAIYGRAENWILQKPVFGMIPVSSSFEAVIAGIPVPVHMSVSLRRNPVCAEVELQHRPRQPRIPRLYSLQELPFWTIALEARRIPPREAAESELLNPICAAGNFGRPARYFPPVVLADV
jgi:hypothetical protein